MRARDLPCERRDSHVERPRIARRSERPHRKLAVCKALAGLERPAQNCGKTVGVLQKIGERTTPRLVETEGEEILRRDVRVNRAQLRVEHDDAGRQRVDELCRIEVRERRRQTVFNRQGAPRGAPRRSFSTRRPPCRR